MTGELYINGKDAWTEWGVNMGDGFLDAIDSFVPIKGLIENESRLQDGKRVILSNIKLDSREITLKFTIKGNSEEDFRNKRKAFETELRQVLVSVNVPALGEDVYRLLYLGKNVSYGMNTERTFCVVSAKFEEPNPADRAPQS